MLITLIVTVVALAVIMGAMAIGVMVSGRRLQGSCGGAGSGDCACDAAGVPLNQRACVTGAAPSARSSADELVSLKR